MSNSSSNSQASGGIGIAGLLGVAFIVLKLLHKITWPWVWVLAPFWICIGFTVAVLVVILLVAVIAWSVKRGSHR
jgi:hypothetical protein